MLRKAFPLRGRWVAKGEPDEVASRTQDIRIEKMNSIAGTAIGRPCYVIQHASAVKISTISPVGLTQ